MTSRQELESQSTEFLCDYIYVDNVKLAHFYSQLSENGLVSQTKKTSKDSSTERADVKVSAMVAGGTFDTRSTAEEGLELTIDAAFTRPQETLDALDERGFIHRDLTGAAMGNLVLFAGNVSIFDIRMLKDLWPLMGNAFAENETAHVTNPKEKQKLVQQLKKNFEEIATLLQKLPHALQGTVVAEDGSAWFTLNPIHMLSNPEDLTFKHGSDLKGTWHILGILDAHPDSFEPDVDQSNLPSSDMETMMRQVLGAVRTMFGRPADRYGITPVMIFRAIPKLET